ncbi:hypothetical protein CYLTODRAFT_407753 [Cylindrobasidium torrendii FP15055 ss-10]|uniref:Uncharacterized protein n=1 Tax=Cylindrobasidium torrendii FP15055 ss-10 TaxID=1314674 RepID=A0A0D7BN42_9AGAR|nr:hypothetical protein CYLTODRAFT_407753 [Cylindrobasidium torrendii FP15055 ss-10]
MFGCVRLTFEDQLKLNMRDSEQSLWLKNLLSCGFELEFSKFMITKCQFIPHRDDDLGCLLLDASSPVLDILYRLPRFSAATWNGIVRGQKLFKLLSPGDVPHWQARAGTINKEAYIDIVYTAGQLTHIEHYDPDGVQLGPAVSFYCFLAPIFQELGWYTTSHFGPLYHPVVQSVRPHYKYAPDLVQHDVLYNLSGRSRIRKRISAVLCTSTDHLEEDTELASRSIL